MADSYAALRTKFLQWSNRDAEVFGQDVAATGGPINDIIYDFFKYAADKAYRTLRIPVFERTYAITIDEVTHADLIENNRLPVPPDLTEFIHIRLKNAFGNENSLILNEKADTRTFHDYYAEKYDVEYTWTRQGRYIYLPRNPGIVAGQQWEIFYYGRAPQIGSAYDATLGNYLLNTTTRSYVTQSDDGIPLILAAFTGDGVETNFEFDVADNDVLAGGYGIFVDGTEVDDADVLRSITQGDTVTIGLTFVNGAPAIGAIIEARTDETYAGAEVNNWFVHENERVLLFGALAEAFAYLSEEDMMQKYVAMFTSELQELNKEEEMRHASGGNVRMNFDGRGLI